MARKKNHPGSIDKRGDTYRLRLCVAKQHFTYNLTDVSRADVEEFARKEHEKLRAQHELVGVGLPGSMRFSALVSRFTEDVLPTPLAGHASVLSEVPETPVLILCGPPQGPQTPRPSRAALRAVSHMATHPWPAR